MMFNQGKWEMKVENGTYEVTVCAGDEQYNSTPTVNVEGVNYWLGINLGLGEHIEATKTVTVSDGRITMDNEGTEDLVTKINYVKVVRIN